MKILFLTNIPSPYRVNFFNELGKHCDLTVLFEKAHSNIRDKEWKKYSFDNFTGIIMNGVSTATDEALCFKVVKYLKMNWDKIICANVSTPTGMLAIQYMKIFRIPYWIEGDGGFPKSGKGLKEKIKKYFISGAEGYFSTGVNYDNYLLNYGAKKELIYHYPFTSLCDKDIEEACKLKQQNILELKKVLGITEDKIVLSVGRFSYQNGYGKGYDTLCEAIIGLDENIGVYIVGDEPTEEFIKLKAEKHLDKLHFIGFKKKKDLALYYATADLFVLLTRKDAWGLVINEAMSFGLPIITTNMCGAGLSLIEDGKNGYIVPAADPKQVHDKIKNILHDDSLREIMSFNNLKKIQQYSIENMAKRHLEVLDKI